MLIHRITQPPYTRENPAMEFGGKVGENVLTEVIKEKLKLVKKLRGYTISSISNPVVKVVTQILAGNFI